MMNKNKSLQYNFGMEAIPVLFHGQTNEFMKYLDKDGLKFLHFWWNHVGDKLPEDQRVSPIGLNFEVELIDKKTKLVLITLPTPKHDQDPFFLALIARPERRLLWVRLPTTEGFALIRDESVKEEHKTSFGYVTPNGLFRLRGVGLNPTKKDFIRTVKNKISKRK